MVNKMVTALQQKILSLGKVEFESGVKDSDYLVVQEYRSKGFFYLYDKNGRLLDIQVGEVIDKKFTQKRPKLQSISSQGPVAKKRGRPSKKTSSTDVKIVEKQSTVVLTEKTSLGVKQKRQYKMSDEQRQKRAERMRATMKTYWEKKKGEAK